LNPDAISLIFQPDTLKLIGKLYLDGILGLAILAARTELKICQGWQAMNEQFANAIDYFIELLRPFHSSAGKAVQAVGRVYRSEFKSTEILRIAKIECVSGFWAQVYSRGTGTEWEYSSRRQVEDFGQVRPIRIQSPADVMGLIERDITRLPQPVIQADAMVG
jgi:hypothetical protein